MNTINDSRTGILSRIKSAKPKARPLPDIPQFEVPGKPIQNFIAHLKGFDGNCRLFASRVQAIEWLRQQVLAANKDKKVFSATNGIEGTCTLADFATPADMAAIDVCIAEATMAVGETGSLLVDTHSLGAPAAALFSTDLYLLIDRNKMFDGLQEAYAHIDFTQNRYTTFFSGPSATADIEAVHITGAQGEISLTAVMYGCSDDDIKAAAEIMERLPKGTPLGQPDAPALSLRRHTNPAAGQDSV